MTSARRNRNSRLLLACLAAIVSAPAAAQSTLTPEQLSIRVERLTETNKRIEEVMVGMRDQVKQLSENVARQERLIDNRAMLDMIQQVDDLADEMSQLNGLLEQQGHDLDEIKKRQRELYLDIDRRLRDIESRAVARAPAQSIEVPRVDPAAGTGAAVEPAAGEQITAPESLPEPAAGAGETSTASLSPTPSVTQSEEKAAYQAAFDTLKEGRYKKAKIELKTFLDKFPNSSFAGNAQYWLGEAHYVTRNFDQGIVEFEKVLQGYPTSNKVPDAMLKLGYTYYELRQFAQAKATLQLLREKFPKSTASRLAAKRLDRIRKEGN